jgi:aldehyde dehydrogenase (NAD+)
MEAIHAALAKDLGRTKTETALGETTPVFHEAVYSYNNVNKWVKDIKPETTLTFQMMNPRVKPSPKGVVLIIGPFNYPINLTFTPLVSALAAGCCAVLKLPESLATTTPLLAALVAKYLDPDVVRVVQGAVDEMTAASLFFHLSEHSLKTYSPAAQARVESW